MPVPVPTPNKAPEIQGNDPNIGSGMEAPGGSMNLFAKASKICTITGPTITQVLSSANAVVPVRVPTFGYIKKIWLEVVVASAGNSAAVTNTNIDAPWTVFRNVLFKDVNGTQIVNLDGYSLFLANKTGGYYLFGAENSTLAFVAMTTGAGATAGSFTCVHEINCCFGRDGLGALANMDASQQYQIDLTFGALSEIYGVAPNGTVTATVRVIMEAFANPPRQDQFNNQNQVQPPGFGTTQFWSLSSFPLVTGENTIQLTRLGNTIRNHLLVWRDGSNIRSNTLIPAGNITFEWDTGFRFQETALSRRAKFFRENGYDAQTGVLPYQYTLDPEGLPIAEYGDQWWQTLGSTRLIVRTTPGATGALQVLTNDAVIRGRPVPM